MNPNQRRARLNLRRRIKAVRQFDVALVSEDPWVECLTCRTCGRSETKTHDNKRVSKALRRKLTAYRTTGSGVTGVCKHCTKVKRDERCPLK